MARGKHILVCRSGAKLVMSEDGSLAYMGGDAYAIGVSAETRFDVLKAEMADMWDLPATSVTVKYLLPNTSNNLVTIASDRDLKSMLEFYEDASTVDVYVFNNTSNSTSNVSTMPSIRSNHTTNTVEIFISGGTVLPRPERVVRADQVPRSDVLAPPERVIGAHQVPPERVISANQVPLPERVIGVDQVPHSDVLSHPERVIHANQVPCSDVLSRSECEAPNELAVYSESEMLKNSKERDWFRLARLWENGLTGVQQQFNSANDFRDAVRKYSVAQGFTCIKTENNSNQFSGKCKSKGCPWEISASKLDTSKHFVVRKFNDIHTCGAKKVSSK